MKTSPFFSILIPTFNRPELISYAIESVLLQGFEDLEIIISNNGANEKTREVSKKYLIDPRVKYYENNNILNMPEHWDKLGQLFCGKYFLILTDRCLLKKGALNYLFIKIKESKYTIDVISWPWDLYLDKLGILLPSSCSTQKLEVKEINSNEYFDFLAANLSGVDYSMPRGLNSCVERKFYSKIVNIYGTVFKTISPDVTFSMYCIMNTPKFWYVNGSLFVSQGADVSNGGRVYTSTAEEYLAT